MEGALLLVKAFPVFMIASPSFVGTLSAYCAARAADLSWGNRPAASPEEQVRRRLALKLPVDDDALMSRWHRGHVRRMHPAQRAARRR